MSSPAIRVENLSKQYHIGSGIEGEYRTLRDSLTRAIAAPIRGIRRFSTRGRLNANRSRLATNSAKTIWALKDVTFDVQPGEVVGIIGRNGAGKSTLLKMISRVTEPTAGRVAYRGRLSSLLEVGTGFHFELTGRENIYLNGAILGMSKREIDQKFAEIVDFAEIEQFLDTPVKRYSSGMTVRLAFSVAAHLRPDILLLDEVLSVGDAGFREKCIRKIKETLASNVSVLFVSHQKSQITDICRRCIVLHNGSIAYIGDPERCWAEYVRLVHCKEDSSGSTAMALSNTRLLNVVISDQFGRSATIVNSHDPLTIQAGYFLERDFQQVGIAVNFLTAAGTIIADCKTFQDGFTIPHAMGEHQVTLKVDAIPLAAGNYLIGVRLYDNCSGQALDGHYRRYAITVEGEADDFPLRLPHSWGRLREMKVSHRRRTTGRAKVI